MLSRDEFLEHAQVYGEHYGVPKSQVRDALASGQDVVMRLDVQGAATLRRLAPEALLIFVSTSSEEELIRRLQARRTESPETLRRRLDTIEQEVNYIPLFDYIVINRDGQLDEAVTQIMAIISAEKCRVRPRIVSI
jgi:guanylate kinase